MRAATLDAWRRSPTRLQEDAAAEADLRRGGYRDRILTELAQNAADAAAEAGIAGELTVDVDRDTAGAGDRVLRVSNTGAPLDREGVVTLCALRASTKTGGVGRFGVGFTAVTALGDEAAIRSVHGGVAFSAARTRRAVAEAGMRMPDVGVPVLRLPWPDAAPPTDGADTEVIVRLRRDVDTAALVESMCAEAPELLLALPVLRTVRVGERTWTRRDGDYRRDADLEPVEGPRADGRLRPAARMLRIEESGDSGAARGDGSAWLEVSAPGTRWLVRVDDGRVMPLEPDVLRAPTRSDEELSLPALLIADVPMAPDRRRLMPGASLGDAAGVYPHLVRQVDPEQRLRVVPEAGFPRGPVDAQLREDVAAALRSSPWLPTVQGRDVAARDAVVVAGLTPDLAEVLGETIDALVPPSYSGARARALIAPYGVRIVDAAGLAEMLSGIDRPPAWWGRLYGALEPLTSDSAVLDQLGALPVPLADGRTVTGPRTVVVGAGLGGHAVGEPGDVPGLPWVRLVHPEAAHDLLLRLGASQAGAEELLADPALRAAVEAQLDAALDGDGALDGDAALDGDGVLDGAPAGGADGSAGGGVGPLAAAVLALVRSIVARPGVSGALPDWLGMLPLPDEQGELRAADELLAPGAPLGEVLVDDAPFGVLNPAVVDAYGLDTVCAVGVGWGFGLVHEESPTGPDHDLDDEADWWAQLEEEPETLVAVRDLDLVDPSEWGAALARMADDGRIGPLLADRAGYTAWWLRRHARIGGVPVAAFRGEDPSFPGLLDPFPGVAAVLDDGVLAGGSVDGPELAAVLVDRLADPARTTTPAEAARAHARLAEAVENGAVGLDDLDVPESVRTADGTVAAAESAVVLDRPWLAAAVPAGRLVIGSLRGAGALAELLDVEVASQAVRGTVTSSGRSTTWAEETGAVVAAAQRGEPVPAGPVVIHDDGLTVRVEEPGEDPREVTVPWWVDDEGIMHTDGAWGPPLRVEP